MKIWKKLLVPILLFCVILQLCCFGVAASASANEAVNNVSKGVLRLNIVYMDDYDHPDVLPSGTCFLINNTNAVTAAHVIDIDEDIVGYFLERHPEKTEQDIRSRLKYTVTISRDVTIDAKVMHRSNEMDFAIISLASSLQDRIATTIRHSSEVQVTEKVYAIGFPEISRTDQGINTFTASDVTITDGSVSKITTRENLWVKAVTAEGGNPALTDYIQTNCQLDSGISGGPMVDVNGYVIGICQGHRWNSTDGYFYAISIDQLLTVCNTLGIQYSLADSAVTTPATPTPVPVTSDSPVPDPVTDPEPLPEVDLSSLRSTLETASHYNKSEYTEESYQRLTDAIKAGNEAIRSSTTQQEVNSAIAELNSAIAGLTSAPKSNTLLYIIIAVAALIVIVVVVLVVVLSSKKKQSARPAGSGSAGTRPTNQGGQTFQPTPRQEPARGSGTIPLDKAGETTVLSQGAGETTVLSQPVSGGILNRVKNNERININRAEMTIGRDRSKVSVCISDNGSIGREHARLTVRNGATYIQDLNSRNGTFVNDVKLRPNEEVELKNGSRITLADEKFEFFK